MNTTNTIKRTFIQGTSKVLERERSFKLSLHALVTGIDACGRKFEEQTRILSISANKVIFPLETKILIQTPLALSLTIPKTLILRESLNLFLSGKVVLVQIKDEDHRQVISLVLNRSYKIQPVSVC